MSEIMDTAEKYHFMVKKFGKPLADEYVGHVDSIEKAFKFSLFAEYVIDNFLLRREKNVR